MLLRKFQFAKAITNSVISWTIRLITWPKVLKQSQLMRFWRHDRQHMSSTARISKKFDIAVFFIKYWSAIIHKDHYMQWLVLYFLTCPFLPLQQLLQRCFWHRWIVASRHFGFWGFRKLFWRMLCHLSLLGCDVAHVFGSSVQSFGWKLWLNFRVARITTKSFLMTERENQILQISQRHILILQKFVQSISQIISARNSNSCY